MKKVRVGVLSPARTVFALNFVCLHLSACTCLPAMLPARNSGWSYIGMAMTAMPMITRTAAETASM